MSQVVLNPLFIAQAALGCLGGGLALKFAPINSSTVQAQTVAFLVSSIVQYALEKKSFKTLHYFSSFLAIAGAGALLKTSWKISLLTSLAFTTLQLIFSYFRKIPKPTAPVGDASQNLDIQLTCSTNDSKMPTSRYVKLKISPKLQQDSELLPPSAVEFVFCVDVSGSMRDKRIDKVKSVLNSVIDTMKKDLESEKKIKFYISIITFDDKAKTVQPKVQVDPKNVARLRQVVTQISTCGETNIMAGLEESTKAFTTNFFWNRSNCVKSLIFLTDGCDESAKTGLGDLQKTWVKESINLFAIGISKDHDVGIMRQIIHDQQGKPLPNSVYQWVPDKEGTSQEGVSLEAAVDAIFKQTTNQIFESISVRPIAQFPIEMLNGNQNGDRYFELGGLSKSEKIEKFFYSDSLKLKEIKLDIKAKTFQGEERQTQVTLPLDESYDQPLYLQGIQQRIVAMNKKLGGIKDKAQRTALAEPLLKEAGTLNSSDADFQNLIGDLKKAIEGEEQAHDALARGGRLDRGRFVN